MPTTGSGGPQQPTPQQQPRVGPAVDAAGTVLGGEVVAIPVRRDEARRFKRADGPRIAGATPTPALDTSGGTTEEERVRIDGEGGGDRLLDRERGLLDEIRRETVPRGFVL